MTPPILFQKLVEFQRRRRASINLRKLVEQLPARGGESASIEKIEILLADGANLNQTIRQPNESKISLFNSLLKKDIGAAQLLLEHGATPDQESVGILAGMAVKRNYIDLSGHSHSKEKPVFAYEVIARKCVAFPDLDWYRIYSHTKSGTDGRSQAAHNSLKRGIPDFQALLDEQQVARGLTPGRPRPTFSSQDDLDYLLDGAVLSLNDEGEIIERQEALENISWLIEKGANPNATSSKTNKHGDSFTIVGVAITNMDTEGVQLLMEAGGRIDPLAITHAGRQILFVSTLDSMTTTTEIVEMLKDGLGTRFREMLVYLARYEPIDLDRDIPFSGGRYLPTEHTLNLKERLAIYMPGLEEEMESSRLDTRTPQAQKKTRPAARL